MTSADGDDRGAGLEPPGRTLDVAPTPLRGSGGHRRRGIVALASVALVLVTAIGLAQTAGPMPRHAVDQPSPVAVVPGPSAGDAVTAPEPSLVSTSTTSQRLRPAQLAAAVRDGALEGRLVFIDGVMDVTPVHCQSLKEGWRGCVKLVIPGVGVPVWAADALHPWPGDPPPGAWLVTVARTGGLVYLGSLVPDRDRVAGLTALEAKLAAPGAPAAADGSLFEVDGSLVPLPRRTCADACPASSPFLVDKLATVGELLSSSGITVVVDSGTPEVDRDAAVVQGTFLVARQDDGEDWQVVARYVPGRSFRVLVP